MDNKIDEGMNNYDDGLTAENSYNESMSSENIAVYTRKLQHENKKLKKHIVVLCVVCAVVGGIAGGLTNRAIDSIFLTPTTEEFTNEALNEEIPGETLLDDVEPSSDESLQTEEESQSEVAVIEETTMTSPVIAEPSTVEGIENLTARDIYSNSVNSVVGIETSITYTTTDFFGRQINNTGRSAGSGFVLSESGYILTNYHVVEGGTSFKVTMYNDDEYTAKLVGYEADNDIAILKIQAEGLQPVSLGDFNNLRVGDSVLIIGNPLGELTYTLTSGVVSSLKRQIQGNGVSMNMFQTDAAVNSGNSGGPIFDMNGEVIGIATSKYASETIEGLSFGIPINDVKNMIQDIIRHGYVTGKPSIGVSVQTITSQMASYYRLPIGAYVVAVGSETAATKAGLQKEDVITGINSTKISGVDSLKEALTKHKAGDEVNLTVYRNDESITISLVFDEAVPDSARTNYSNVFDL